MLNSIHVAAAVGTLLGILAGMGVGGGSLLVLWLTLVLDLPADQARVINLLFFLPSAFISTFFRVRQNTLQLKNIFPAIIAGCLFAAASAAFTSGLELTLLRKLFGILLLFTGLRELTV